MQNIPVVKQLKNEIYADSRDVAEYFGKMHKHVLDSINDCINDCPNLVAEFSAAKYKPLN